MTDEDSGTCVKYLQSLLLLSNGERGARISIGVGYMNVEL